MFLYVYVFCESPSFYMLEGTKLIFYKMTQLNTHTNEIHL